MKKRQHHLEEHLSAKMEVKEKNAHGNSEDSQPNLHKNGVDWCWESVKDEQVCKHDPQHHWAMVELLNEREVDNPLRQCLLPHEIVQFHQRRSLSEA